MVLVKNPCGLPPCSRRDDQVLSTPVAPCTPSVHPAALHYGVGVTRVTLHFSAALPLFAQQPFCLWAVNLRVLLLSVSTPLNGVMQTTPEMFFNFCHGLFQTFLSLAKGLHKPLDEMFCTDLFNKEKISIQSQRLLTFKVHRWPWPGILSSRSPAEFYLQTCSWRGVDIPSSGSISMSRKLLSDVIVLSENEIRFYFQYLAPCYSE